ncbi:PVC-type heme-binding CxxCH protein [Membranihabitans maritimus]|uniref:PVC-type heme-binding CxxCH protein n=1 Tax=Membranihabitans maritimus TaxID=2904244 RepID=UPI001F2E8DC7|nr:PVC-type heme-binding CxxCH protein [Membranihabitans maritimus]
MKICIIVLFSVLLVGCSSNDGEKQDDLPRPIEVLFLGHASEHHDSYKCAPILVKAFTKDGINISYSENTLDLNDKNLESYDALIIYANHEEIGKEQEKALLDFVKGGKGFVPIHCASFCFQNSEEYIDMVGGQFKEHETGIFTAEIVDNEHPLMTDIDTFSTWDETYVHHKLSEDRTVLMERVEGEHREPWTWVKDYGDGKVFYTAYGHDERTWNNPGFQKLIKEGIKWVVNDHVKDLWTKYNDTLPQLQYVEMDNIPNYEKRDPAPQYQKPLSPRESRLLTQVPPGFELKLFVSEPDIVNPISMDWDEKGRLWVIETVDYPNTVRNDKGQGDDRIKICEDTDGDGRADTFTVFAEGLNIPTSFTFANGGIIVSQAPQFLFLKDTDGDDKADVKEVLMEGWGTFDTHAGPSNLQYGLDNRIWGTVGYSGFEGNIDGEELKFRQGFYSFNKDGTELEVLTYTSNNTWGLGFSEGNSVFGSTANNTHSVFMGIPNRYYEGIEGIRPFGSAKIDGHYAMHTATDKVRQVDVFGGFTAAAGHRFYTARKYPEEYWNKYAFVCEPTGHLVHIARIEKEGAGYIEKDGWNLVAGADEWFSPVEAKVGPDGNVWIADWYNFIVQHNPTPSPDRGGYQAENGDGNAYVNPLRDKEHGRIWRLVQKSDKQGNKLELSKEDPQELIHELNNSNMFWRTTAQRLLVERGEIDVEDDLVNMVANQELNEIHQNPGALHAFWALEGLGYFASLGEDNVRLLQDALNHASVPVQRAAIQILERFDRGKKVLLESNVWNDSDPEVRLAGIISLVGMKENPDIGMELFNMYGNDPKVVEDEWLSQALYLAAAKHKSGFLKGYVIENGKFDGSGLSEEEKTEWLNNFLLNYWSDDIDFEVASIKKGSSAATESFEVGVIQNEMKYDVSEIEVTAGASVEITFSNPDFMQHNLVIGEMGALQTIGAAADKMALDPDGAEKQYVPDIDEVLFSTPLVNPEEQYVLKFTAPSKAGEYPFVCTFPGHWRIMNGVMKVVGSEKL